MQSRQCAVLSTLIGVSKTHHKLYCYPSQVRILQLLKKYQGFVISRRSLCRDLLCLEAKGFIRRVRRLKRAVDGRLLFNSTLYKFTVRAFKYLFGLGKWVKGVFSSFRVPKLSHNKSQRENEIYHETPGTVENLLTSQFKGVLRH